MSNDDLSTVRSMNLSIWGVFANLNLSIHLRIYHHLSIYYHLLIYRSLLFELCIDVHRHTQCAVKYPHAKQAWYNQTEHSFLMFSLCDAAKYAANIIASFAPCHRNDYLSTRSGLSNYLLAPPNVTSFRPWQSSVLMPKFDLQLRKW